MAQQHVSIHLNSPDFSQELTYWKTSALITTFVLHGSATTASLSVDLAPISTQQGGEGGCHMVERSTKHLYEQR